MCVVCGGRSVCCFITCTIGAGERVATVICDEVIYSSHTETETERERDRVTDRQRERK